MSLNGLDSAAVREAYESSVGEPGGWFLLKYATRDAVELLSRGTGGVSEVREAVAQYTEQSPLYGFIRYRRRSVLVKYVPDGTSRLLQARLTVHFQSIIDTFTPHDTIFTIASADDLKDSLLSAACSLHAASISASSSTSSVQRQRLVEIAEDEEEGSTIRARSENATPTEATHPNIARDIDSERLKGASTTLKALETHRAEVRPEDKPLPASPTKRSLDLETRSIHDGSKSPKSSKSSQTSPTQGEVRLSTSSLRPSTRDILDMYPYGFKPKVKLGPRPSMDPGKRPQTAGSASNQSEVRPVSTLPPGIRLAPRKSQTERPSSQHSTISTNGVMAPPPIPMSAPTPAPVRPTTSPGKIPLSGSGGHVSKQKSSTTLLEKQRLMKAMQLRKKQMKNPVSTQSEKTGDSETPVSIMPTQDDEVVTPMTDMVDENTEETVLTSGRHGEDASIPSEEAEHQDAKIAKSPNSLPIIGSHLPETHSIEEPSLPAAPETHTSEVEDKVAGMAKKTELTNSIHGDDSITQASLMESAPTEEHKSTRDTSSHVEAEEVVPSISSANEGFKAEKGEEDYAINPSREAMVPLVMVEPILGEAVGGSHEASDSDDRGEAEHEAAKEEIFAQENGDLHKQETTEHAAIVAEEKSSHSQRETDDARSAEDEECAKTSTTTIPSVNDDELEIGEQSRLNHRKRRSKLVKPIKTDIADISDDGMLTDDSLMDELDTATLEEAQPVSVAKSPLTPVSPRSMTDDMLLGDSPRSQRSTSNPAMLMVEPVNHRFSTEVPVIETARSVSAARLNAMRAQQSPVAIAKKVNVSSGISQRIKALEMRSSSNTPPLSSAPSPNGSPSFNNIRNTSLRAPPSRSASNASHRSPVGKLTPSPSPSSSPEQLAPLKRADRSINKQENLKPSPKAGSISVTARIIRDPKTALRDGVEGDSEVTPLGFYQSPIVIEHQGPPMPLTKLAPIPSSERPISAVLPASPTTDTTATKTNRASASSSSRRSSSDRRRSEPKTPKSPRSPPASSGSFPNGISEEGKKESTKDRLMRRMSSISSQSRKSLAQAISPTVREEDQGLGDLRAPLQSLSTGQNVFQVIGEVNVQFPDNLLWKRRCLNLDGQGNIILTQSEADENTKVASRRFHLSEFLPPFAPDHDRQELPYSVVLDHLDGGTLQCACENLSGQSILLTTLRQAYRAVHATT